MKDVFVIGLAVSLSALFCVAAGEFWAAWFRWRNRRDNERWLRSNATYFDDMDAELEEILRG